jgi:hypothetical protein
LVDVAARLRHEPIVGDGAVTRVGRELQRAYLGPPPDLSPSKYC